MYANISCRNNKKEQTEPIGSNRDGYSLQNALQPLNIFLIYFISSNWNRAQKFAKRSSMLRK